MTNFFPFSFLMFTSFPSIAPTNCILSKLTLSSIFTRRDYLF